VNANADTPGRWDQMGTDGLKAKTEYRASCFEWAEQSHYP
jgi:hypothetical protein